MISIGITGIIGSGKSMLSQVFRSMDIPVYDADTRAKELMNNNFAIRIRLKLEFGEETYRNNKINKEYLRKIVFGNEKNRQIINSIVHPAVKNDFIAWREKTGAKIVAIESAIIFDAKLEDILDKIIFVEAAEDILVKRICFRDRKSVV